MCCNLWRFIWAHKHTFPSSKSTSVPSAPSSVTVYDNVLQCMAVCCSMLQNVVICGDLYEHINTPSPRARAHRSQAHQVVLQCVAVCCSVWQCVAMRCSVFQFEANCTSTPTHLALEQEHISLKRSKYLSKSFLCAQPPPPVTHPLHHRLSTLGALYSCSWCTRVCACVCVSELVKESIRHRNTHTHTSTHKHTYSLHHRFSAFGVGTTQVSYMCVHIYVFVNVMYVHTYIHI